MTQADIESWLSAQGVDPNVIAQEAPYLAEHYGGDDAATTQALQGALGGYLQRSKSGGDRSQGGYSTTENDPAMGAAPARFDSRLMPTASSGAGGGLGFTEVYSTLERPSYLQGPYVPPTWNESFVAPSYDTLRQDAGYQARLAAGQQAFDRSAASRGTLLNGGTLKALNRYAQDFGANEYQGAYNRAFDAYKQKYGQFQDQAAMGAQARNLNETAYQNDANNALTQYQQRYRTYQDAIQNNMDFARLGLGATTAGSPA